MSGPMATIVDGCVEIARLRKENKALRAARDDAVAEVAELRGQISTLRGEVAEATKILGLVPDAFDSLMTEYVSKRGACDWGLVNDCLVSVEEFLRTRAALEGEG